MIVNGKGMFCRHRQCRTVRIRRNAFAAGRFCRNVEDAVPYDGDRPVERGAWPLWDSAGIRERGAEVVAPYAGGRCGFAGEWQWIRNDPQGTSTVPFPVKRKMKPPAFQTASIQLCCFTARDRGT